MTERAFKEIKGRSEVFSEEAHDVWWLYGMGRHFLERKNHVSNCEGHTQCAGLYRDIVRTCCSVISDHLADECAF